MQTKVLSTFRFFVHLPFTWEVTMNVLYASAIERLHPLTRASGVIAAATAAPSPGVTVPSEVEVLASPDSFVCSFSPLETGLEPFSLSAPVSNASSGRGRTWGWQIHQGRPYSAIVAFDP